MESARNPSAPPNDMCDGHRADARLKVSGDQDEARVLVEQIQSWAAYTVDNQDGATTCPFAT